MAKGNAMVDPRKLADDFASGLKRDLGDRMRSAALFGSAARGEWIAGVSDVNVLVLVDSIDVSLLARAASQAATATARGVAPLMIALEEWRKAADVFSIELADMQDAHIVLDGEDPVAHFEPNHGQMRLQAEHELRAKLLQLHGGMLLCANDPARLGGLLVHALPSFATYLRAALRLSGEAVPGTMEEVLDRGCQLIGADAAPFQRIQATRKAGSKLKLDLRDPAADAFNTTATQLAAYIDQYGR